LLHRRVQDRLILYQRRSKPGVGQTRQQGIATNSNAHVGALPIQQFGNGFTDVAVGTGDKGEPAVESSTDFIPYVTLICKFRYFIAIYFE
jgi:hypothetical protein